MNTSNSGENARKPACLPPSHSGYKHVMAMGHRLALSTYQYSNCAECDWASDATQDEAQRP